MNTSLMPARADDLNCTAQNIKALQSDWQMWYLYITQQFSSHSRQAHKANSKYYPLSQKTA